VFHVFGALAEFEREMIRERTKAGLRAARARGRMNGRPKKLSGQQIKMAKKLMQDKETKVSEISKTMNVSRSTLYRCQTAETLKIKPEKFSTREIADSG
jgi:DNA invertase Pin-like site-specific DNA recombinase